MESPSPHHLHRTQRSGLSAVGSTAVSLLSTVIHQHTCELVVLVEVVELVRSTTSVLLVLVRPVVVLVLLLAVLEVVK